jgi:hypothetical protein
VIHEVWFSPLIGRRGTCLGPSAKCAGQFHPKLATGNFAATGPGSALAALPFKSLLGTNEKAPTHSGLRLLHWRAIVDVIATQISHSERTIISTF